MCVMENVIGIDIHEEFVVGAIFDFKGKVLSRSSLFINPQDGYEICQVILELVHRLASCTSLSLIQGVGVCLPGIANTKEQIVWAPNIGGLINYPLEQELKKSLSQYNIEVVVASDRTCFILGEKWKGQAQDCTNAAFIAVSGGIGLGILLDGQIVHGHGDIVGSLGWMAVQTPFQDYYSKQGCLEYYASSRGIAKQAVQILESQAPLYKESILRHKELKSISSQDVFLAYMKNDALAVRILNQAIELWGMAAANVVSLFNPQKLIWGGTLFGPAQQFIGKIYEEACRWGQPISMQQVSFEKSLLSGDAGLIGAAYLAISTLSKKNKLPL